jgi:hypothetical protein
VIAVTGTAVTLTLLSRVRGELTLQSTAIHRVSAKLEGGVAARLLQLSRIALSLPLGLLSKRGKLGLLLFRINLIFLNKNKINYDNYNCKFINFWYFIF